MLVQVVRFFPVKRLSVTGRRLVRFLVIKAVLMGKIHDSKALFDLVDFISHFR